MIQILRVASSDTKLPEVAAYMSLSKWSEYLLQNTTWELWDAIGIWERE